MQLYQENGLCSLFELYQENGLCSLFAVHFEKEAVPMANADKARLESDYIFSREERIREIQSFNLLSDVFMSVALEDVPACQHVSIYSGS